MSSHTVSQLIHRFIEAMDGTTQTPGLKHLGESHRTTLRKIARMKIGSAVAAELQKHDVIGLTRELKDAGRCPATSMQYVTYLRGVLEFAPSAWEDCEDINAGAVAAARPIMNRLQLIAKSRPRKRIASDEELIRLLMYLGAQDDAGRAKIKMVPFVAAGLVTTRRRGELCRLRRADVDWEKNTYLIRDMKHPFKKKGNHKTFALIPEFAEILRAIPVVDPNDPDERFFPYKGKSVGKRYVLAKQALGIKDLRLHDNRRLAITRWLALLKSPHRVKLISGHETIQILERNYDATDPASINEEVALLQRPGILSNGDIRVAA